MSYLTRSLRGGAGVQRRAPYTFWQLAAWLAAGALALFLIFSVLVWNGMGGSINAAAGSASGAIGKDGVLTSWSQTWAFVSNSKPVPSPTSGSTPVPSGAATTAPAPSDSPSPVATAPTGGKTTGPVPGQADGRFPSDASVNCDISIFSPADSASCAVSKFAVYWLGILQWSVYNPTIVNPFDSGLLSVYSPMATFTSLGLIVGLMVKVWVESFGQAEGYARRAGIALGDWFVATTLAFAFPLIVAIVEVIVQVIVRAFIQEEGETFGQFIAALQGNFGAAGLFGGVVGDIAFFMVTGFLAFAMWALMEFRVPLIYVLMTVGVFTLWLVFGKNRWRSLQAVSASFGAVMVFPVVMHLIFVLALKVGFAGPIDDSITDAPRRLGRIIRMVAMLLLALSSFPLMGLLFGSAFAGVSTAIVVRQANRLAYRGARGVFSRVRGRGPRRKLSDRLPGGKRRAAKRYAAVGAEPPVGKGRSTKKRPAPRKGSEGNGKSSGASAAASASTGASGSSSAAAPGAAAGSLAGGSTKKERKGKSKKSRSEYKAGPKVSDRGASAGESRSKSGPSARQAGAAGDPSSQSSGGSRGSAKRGDRKKSSVNERQSWSSGGSSSSRASSEASRPPRSSDDRARAGREASEARARSARDRSAGQPSPRSPEKGPRPSDKPARPSASSSDNRKGGRNA